MPPPLIVDKRVTRRVFLQILLLLIHSRTHLPVTKLQAAVMDFTLKPHATLAKPDGPVLVCILDGWVRELRR